MKEKVRLLKTALGVNVAQEDWDYARKWIETVTFERTVWTPRHALLRSDGAVVEYIGQDYAESELKWLENGWTEDICELCEHKIKKGDSGWTQDGRHWLCIECYDLLRISNAPPVESRSGDDDL